MCMTLKLNPHVRQGRTRRPLASDFAQRLVPKPPASPSASTTNLLTTKTPSRLDKYDESERWEREESCFFSFSFPLPFFCIFPCIDSKIYLRVSSGSFRSTGNLLASSGTGSGIGGIGYASHTKRKILSKEEINQNRRRILYQHNKIGTKAIFLHGK